MPLGYSHENNGGIVTDYAKYEVWGSFVTKIIRKVTCFFI
jgi:hypothetical protein